MKFIVYCSKKKIKKPTTLIYPLLSLNKKSNIQTHSTFIYIIGVGWSFLVHSWYLIVLVSAHHSSHPKCRLNSTASCSRSFFFLFFFLIKKDFNLGILEFTFEWSEKKYNFNAKTTSSIQEYIAGVVIFLYVFVFIEKNNQNKINMWDF